MKTITSLRLILAALVLGLAAHAPAQTLLLEYKFNDSGTTTANSGTLGGTAALQNSSAVATDLHGAAGSGVSGLAGDTSLNLSSATGMGSGFAGPMANTGTVSLTSLKSFTLTGWINSTAQLSTLANSARIYDNGVSKVYLSTGGMVISLYNGTSTTDYGSTAMATNNLWTSANQWVFFAITYDGTTTSNNLNFYYGSAAVAISSAATSTSVAANLNLGSGALNIGNRTAADRPFDGSMDNFRLYGSTTDASGALSISALDSLRSLDAVPEPSSMALLLTGALTMGLIHRRRRSGDDLRTSPDPRRHRWIGRLCRG